MYKQFLRYISAALLMIIVGTAMVRLVSAAQTTPPPYTHSWYVTNPDSTVMTNLGYSDGTFDNQNSTNSTVVLNFGQPEKQSGAQYDGYGTYYFAYQNPFMSDSQIVAAVEAYAAGWYSATGTNPRLKMVIGTNNYNQCPFGGSCTPYDAGYQWGNVVNDVQSWLVSTNKSWQITAYAGSDMEQPSGGQIWDCATKTRQFVDGFTANNPSYALFLNYGTAWLPNACWSVQDVQYVSYGAAYNYPLPEIYTAAARDSWVSVRVQGYMDFVGVMTECTGGDPLPTGDCWVGGNINEWQYSPTKAWNEFWNALINNGVGEQSLDYATNIRYQ